MLFYFVFFYFIFILIIVNYTPVFCADLLCEVEINIRHLVVCNVIRYDCQLAYRTFAARWDSDVPDYEFITKLN